MFTLTLLRHGESAGNFQNLIQGQTDLPLTERGIEQARSLAAAWQAQGVQYDYLVSSPLRRAWQTAEAVGAALGLPVEAGPLWKERHFGNLEGLQLEEIRRRQPDLDFNDPYFPVGGDGESMSDLYCRAVQAVTGIIRGTPGRYLVVTHGAFLNAVLLVVMGLAPHSAYQSPRFYFGNTAHLTLTYEPAGRLWRFWSFTNTDTYRPESQRQQIAKG